jgi:hypothetical protein
MNGYIFFKNKKKLLIALSTRKYTSVHSFLLNSGLCKEIQGPETLAKRVPFKGNEARVERL